MNNGILTYRVDIKIETGQGGNGHISFSNRNKADGGNGGAGGNVIIILDKKTLDLRQIEKKKLYVASNGQNGKSNFKNGKKGCDVVLKVPYNSHLYLNDQKKRVVINNYKFILYGGKGGKGNSNKTSNLLNKIGEKKKTRMLTIILNKIYDVSIIGKSNIGKSSFVNVISNCNSKVGHYAYSTKRPTIGVLESHKKTITLADMPGYNELIFKSYLEDIIKKTVLILKFNYSYAPKNFNKYWIVVSKIDKLKQPQLNYNKYYQNVFFISSKKRIGIKKIMFNIGEYFTKIFTNT